MACLSHAPPSILFPLPITTHSRAQYTEIEKRRFVRSSAARLVELGDGLWMTQTPCLVKPHHGEQAAKTPSNGQFLVDNDRAKGI